VKTSAGPRKRRPEKLLTKRVLINTALLVFASPSRGASDISDLDPDRFTVRQIDTASRSSRRRRTELCAEIHNRMPAVLSRVAWPGWLGEEPADAPRLKTLLAPYPSEEMVAWPVSPRVGNVKNNDPSLIEPLAGAG
jgi:hypothetical protein